MPTCLGSRNPKPDGASQELTSQNEPRDDRIARTVRSVGSLCVLGGCDLVGIYRGPLDSKS
jgi:hypothetical protein